ncbi:hypothetical protein HDU79_010968 [Rhizoclosmatium sp. JEL0117]|nr:hypothetical protein HDU79_010968 [Rhizoclosmatium sp. JEL0117]
MKDVLEIRDSVSSSEPYSSIMKAMLAEVVDKVREGKSTNLNDAESIEVGMEAMGISRDQAPSEIVDMRWFMGFLGMERKRTILIQTESKLGSINSVGNPAEIPSSAIVSNIPALFNEVGDSQSSLPSSTLLERYLKVFQEPLAMFGSNHRDLEDPDLLPKFEEWLPIFNFFTENGTVLPRSTWFDAEAFLKNYFHKSPLIRLVFVCMTMRDGVLPIATQIVIFNRARKCTFRFPIIPSAETVYTYFGLSNQAIRFGAFKLQTQFLNVALNMLLELQMDIDPDDLPQCAHLSRREKEERRRIFWLLLLDYCYELSINDEQQLFPLFGDRVKTPSQVYDPAPVFLELSEEVKWRAGLENVIGITKRHYIQPPSSITNLLNAAISGNLLSVFSSYRESVPGIYLLHFEQPTTITSMEEEQFLQQIFELQQFLVPINLLFHSSVSVFYRPIMFLAALPSCRPTYISDTNQAIIINAIHQCYESAWRITSLYLYFGKMEKGQSLVPARLFNLHGGIYHVLEAFIVFWFVSCRMEPVWATLAGLENYNNNILLERMKRVLKLRDSVTTSKVYSNIMKAILAEVVDVIDGRESNGFENGEAIEIGMEAMQISREESSNEMMDIRWYMGFLGMEIGTESQGKKIRFRGTTEESWRLFWKLNA